ncbi:MAG: TauD/TfdA family dioxygenase [Rhodospirillales bacterium]|jgi:taurine dioxygenase|nr:TauD/TfdA family dioxygenase [Rhodospirillales bacterium]MBT4006071.1 TauD/TfdA family dioxygenase [Rhodospirillales bacterium]MBT5112814.1 TauD/TfdA family dioxygenase [Rhodospirillales bacterium]MBT5673584.1 TauD/TfdA family dioxygenase [Rhodospirillales bacterium]MBT6186243.1 TauD/TfdA family dioxygenase [Rhodospirillales bacterium]
MAISIHPHDAALGAEVSGIDCAKPLDGDAIKTIKAAWDKYLVLILRDQKLDDPALLAFSKNFGLLDPPGPNPYGEVFLPDFPEINVISNVIENDRPIGNLGDGEAVWHADMTYIASPPKAAILHALEIPNVGGDTYFANMFAAYDALSPKLQDQIEGLTAIHDAAHNSAGMMRTGYTTPDDIRDTPGAHHPLVRLDPETGRRCLFLGRRPHAYINGLSVPDSETLLDALWEHVSRPEFAMGHQWRAGDLLMWLNLGILHRRDSFDAGARRIIHRTQIKGDEQIRSGNAHH